MSKIALDPDGLSYLKQTRSRLRWLFAIRPNSLAGPLYRLFSPFDRRVVVQVDGIRFACDPLSYTAGEILARGTYEASTVAMLRQHLRPGGVFMDIGANEGFIASVAARVVGASGMIIAVEPQSEVFRVLGINLSMNAEGRVLAVQRALDRSDDRDVTMNLSPCVNTGGASIVRKAFLAKKEVVKTISFAALFERACVPRVDFVKIDVEGYEREVVDSILLSGRLDSVGTVAVDYHASVLAQRGIDPRAIESSLFDKGMKRVESEAEFSGYTLYSRG